MCGRPREILIENEDSNDGEKHECGKLCCLRITIIFNQHYYFNYIYAVEYNFSQICVEKQRKTDSEQIWFVPLVSEAFK